MTNWSRRNFARAGLGRWLQAPGSLSARLAATGEVFSVQVLSQGRQPLSLDEARALGGTGYFSGRLSGYAREVVLRVDGVAMVFARSVTTHHDSLGTWRSVRGLGSRPLADVLFRRTDIAREPLAFGKLQPASRLQRHVASQWLDATGQAPDAASLSARRSVFVRRGAALLVMEVFAAGLPQWAWSRSASKVKTTSRRRV